MVASARRPKPTARRVGPVGEVLRPGEGEGRKAAHADGDGDEERKRRGLIHDPEHQGAETPVGIRAECPSDTSFLGSISDAMSFRM